jgi:hypothetical protein
MSIISQYFKEVKPFPPSGLGGSDNCIYEMTVNSEGGRTFVTLQGKDMNSFGDSDFVGIDGLQQSLLKSLYRSLSDKRKLICEGYGEYLKECGGGSSLKDRGVEEKKCYLTLKSNNKKNIKLYTNISVSIVSQYVTKVEKDDPLIKRPLGKSDSCIYEIVVEQTEDTLFTTVTGEGLNSYGDSDLFGIKGFQQSLLKSIFRSLRDKRGTICDDYRDLLEECKNVVVEEIPKKVEPKVVEKKVKIPKVEPKVVEIPKVIPKVEPKVVEIPKVIPKKVAKRKFITPNVKKLLKTKKCIGCRLDKQDLSGLNLSGAKLSNSNLSGADLSGTNLTQVELYNANLRGANLSNTILVHANMIHANLSGSNLSGSNLRGAELRNAYMRGANLSGANLEGVRLKVTNLSGSNLSGANLKRVNLKEANLNDANLKGAILDDEYLKEFGNRTR